MNDRAPTVRNLVQSRWQLNPAIKTRGWGWVTSHAVPPQSSEAWSQTVTLGFRTFLEVKQPRTRKIP